MRLTEYFDYITRRDLHLGRNPETYEYTHLTITKKTKRTRYQYQLALRKREKNGL